jgi:hypothetical protein
MQITCINKVIPIVIGWVVNTINTERRNEIFNNIIIMQRVVYLKF